MASVWQRTDRKGVKLESVRKSAYTLQRLTYIIVREEVDAEPGYHELRFS